MTLRLKLNDRLVDIASEGLLRPKLYDEKETFDFTTVYSLIIDFLFSDLDD
jgi:hypothetical protein